MPKIITFFKYHGTGNDFIIIDNRQQHCVLSTHQVQALCDRHFGIGADGLMLIENSSIGDFRMTYYNSDGSTSTLCGNGSRCITQCVFDLGLKKSDYVIEAVDGLHQCRLLNGLLSFEIKSPSTIEKDDWGYILNTGSPHLVFFKKEGLYENFVDFARGIRYSEKFMAQQGINVNEVEILGEHKISVRTYERGVENETLSCGTGVCASGIVFALHALKDGNHHIAVETLGGELNVHFEKSGSKFENIRLIGPAKMIFKGEISLEE